MLLTGFEPLNRECFDIHLGDLYQSCWDRGGINCSVDTGGLR